MKLFAIWPLQHRVSLACKPLGLSKVSVNGNSVLAVMYPKER